MIIQNLADVTMGSLLNVWIQVIDFIPALIGAIIILIVGLIIASGLKSLVEKIIFATKLDNFLRRLDLETYLQRANLRLDSGKFLGNLVYWFFAIVSILAAADVLKLEGLSNFLNQVVSYIPNIIAAALIMLATIVIANFLSALVKASVMSAKLQASKFLATLTWWATAIFGLLASLIQLGVAPMLLNTVITGVIAMFALAGGIAFGLGGKDYAAHLLNRLKDRTE